MSTSPTTATNDFDQDEGNRILHHLESHLEVISLPKQLLTREELLKLYEHLMELNLATVLSDSTEFWPYNPSGAYFPKDSYYEAEYIDSYKRVDVNLVNQPEEYWLMLAIMSWCTVAEGGGEITESVFEEDLDNRHEVLKRVIYEFLTEKLGKKAEEISITITNDD